MVFAMAVVLLWTIQTLSLRFNLGRVVVVLPLSKEVFLVRIKGLREVWGRPLYGQEVVKAERPPPERVSRISLLTNLINTPQVGL
jgi:hypothetical protein